MLSRHDGDLWAMLPSAIPGVLLDFERLAAAQAAGADCAPGIYAQIPGAQRVQNTRSLWTLGEMAVLEINGAVLGRDDIFTRAFGLPTFDSLLSDLEAARRSRALMLLIDSPGTVAQGVDAVGTAIAETAARLPTTAYVKGLGASGVYWFAAAAGEISAPASAMLGSIGIALSVGRQDQPDAQGVFRYQLTSSNAPEKRPDPTTDAGRAELRRLADSQETLFVEAVARYRGVPIETVVAPEGFGAGATFTGRDALARGMLDRVESFEQAFVALRRRAGIN